MIPALVCLTVTLSAPPESLQRFQAAESHMGTSFEIVLYASSREQANQAFRAAYERIGELDDIMSDYDPASELSRLSRSAPTPEPVELSTDLYTVLEAANTMSRATEGAFDVTVGPLTKLWRRARRRGEFPAAGLLAQARAATGYQYLRLAPATRSAELLVADMRLDLGGIAKGYAADEVLRTLAAQGVTRAIVNAGGDVVAGDAPPREPGWRVGVAGLQREAPPSRFLTIANTAVATSGDLWQYVELDGVRYSHILNPKTGLGLTSQSSVTVVAPRGMTADSLASAVSVLGPEAGLQLIEQHQQTETLILTRTATGIASHVSTGFEKRVTRE